MFTIGPTFFSASGGDHPEGDGLTRFQTAFAGGSSADISSFANGSGTNTGGTVGAGQYQVTVDSGSAKGLTYGVDTDLGRPANTAYTFECFFNTTVISPVDSVTGMVYVQLMSTGGWAQLSVNGGGNTLNFEDDINGATYYTGSGSFLASTDDHHYAICVETSGNYSVYVDGVRIVGPVAGGNVVHANGFVRLGGIRSGGTSQLQLTFKGVRVRRAVMYSGASFTPPLTPADWGPP